MYLGSILELVGSREAFEDNVVARNGFYDWGFHVELVGLHETVSNNVGDMYKLYG